MPLLALTERLGAGGPLSAKGLAITSLLVRDRSSPLNSEAASRSLAVAARNALLALERGDPPMNTTDH